MSLVLGLVFCVCFLVWDVELDVLFFFKASSLSLIWRLRYQGNCKPNYPTLLKRRGENKLDLSFLFSSPPNASWRSTCDFTFQINIDSSTRETIIKNIQEPTPTCFEEAQKIVYMHMERDSYPRFLKSEMYQKLLKTIQPNHNSWRPLTSLNWRWYTESTDLVLLIFNPPPVKSDIE